jgi:hypothetical protein
MADYRSVESRLNERQSLLITKLFFEKQTLDEEEGTALVFGYNRINYGILYLFVSTRNLQETR